MKHSENNEFTYSFDIVFDFLNGPRHIIHNEIHNTEVPKFLLFIEELNKKKEDRIVNYTITLQLTISVYNLLIINNDNMAISSNILGGIPIQAFRVEITHNMIKVFNELSNFLKNRNSDKRIIKRLKENVRGYEN